MRRSAKNGYAHHYRRNIIDFGISGQTADLRETIEREICESSPVIQMNVPLMV